MVVSCVPAPDVFASHRISSILRWVHYACMYPGDASACVCVCVYVGGCNEGAAGVCVRVKQTKWVYIFLDFPDDVFYDFISWFFLHCWMLDVGGAAADASC